MEKIFGFLRSELDKVLSIRSGDQLYRLFFRLTQAMLIVGFVSTVFGGQYFSFAPVADNYSGAVAKSLMMSIGLMGLAEAGLRQLDRGSIVGFWIGFGLSIYYLPHGFTWLLGILGLFSFFNPKFQQAHLGSAPPFLKQALSKLKINYTDPK